MSLNLPPKIILHVGMTKAGSTSLQNYLDANRTALLERGILFPASVFTRANLRDQTRTSGHIVLLRRLKAGDLGAFAAELDSAAGRAETLFLSAENLFMDRPDEELAMLANLFGDRQVSVIALLREQLGWLASRYTENVMGGWLLDTRTFETFACAMLDEGRLDYLGHLKRLKHVFHRCDIQCIDYDAARRSKRLVSTALLRAGVDLTGMPDPDTEFSNVSVEASYQVEAQRLVNLHLGALRDEERHHYLEKVATARRDRTTTVPRDLVRPDLPVALKRRIRDAVHDGNELIARRYLDGGGFGCPPEAAQRPPAPPSHLDVLDELARRVPDFIDFSEEAAKLKQKRLPALLSRLPMSELETIRYIKALRDANVVLLYGVDIRTAWACANPAGLVFAVAPADADPVRLIREFDDLDLASLPCVMPAQDGDIWRQPFFRPPDLVVIDAANGAACLEQCLNNVRKPTRVLFFGFSACPEREAIAAGLKAIRMTGDMAEFEIAPRAARDREAAA